MSIKLNKITVILFFSLLAGLFVPVLSQAAETYGTGNIAATRAAEQKAAAAKRAERAAQRKKTAEAPAPSEEAPAATEAAPAPSEKTAPQ